MRKHLWYILVLALALCLGIGVLSACDGNEQAETKYTLTYDANGGTGTAPAAGSYAENEMFTVRAGTGLSRDEYVFDGWLDGTTKVPVGFEFRMPAHDVTLKADWKQITYTVTYSLGDHAAADATVPTQDPVAKNAEITLPAAPAAEAKWDFDGWYAGSVKLTDQYTVTGDVTITAHWKQNRYTVTYDLGDHAAEGATAPARDYVAKDTAIALPNAPAAEAEWEFDGWYVDSTKLTDTTYFVEGNVTITAHWKQVTYTVAYSLGNHAAEDAAVPTQEPVTKGTAVNVPEAPKAEAGWEFDGWYADSAKLTDATYSVQGDVTITAHWKAAVCSVTYDLGDHAAEGELVPQHGSVSYGTAIPVAAAPNAAIDYVFDGWYIDTAKLTEATYTVKGNVTITAHWTRVKYTITYDLGDHAAEDAAAPEQDPVISETAIELPATVPAAKGYTFAGWKVGTKDVAADNGKYTYTVDFNDAKEDTVTLEAQYTANQYNVSFDKAKVGEAEVENWPTFSGTVSLDPSNNTIEILDEPACDGWEFKGWSLNGKDLGKTLEVTLTAEDLPEEDMPLVFTAQWKKTLSVTVSANREKITVKITGEDDVLANGAKLVSMETYEYYQGDASHGMSQHYSEGTEVGEYKSEDFGEDVTIEVARLDGQRDRLYDKYYLVKDNMLLKGPYYVSKVLEPMENGSESAPAYMNEITTMKGVLAEDVNAAIDLGAQHARWDFCLDGFYYPDASAGSADAVGFQLNGKTFYFHQSRVDAFDNIVQTYSNLKMDIIVVVYIHGSQVMPEAMTYREFGAWDIGTPGIAGYNTSNEGGLEWWAATMEFFAQRYSGAEGSKGYISTYVIGNEIDFEGDYFRIAKDHQPVETYVEEYGRCLRIADLAVKKYNPDIQVTTTLTHSWVEPGNTSGFNERNYSPKQILELLNAKSKREGDFNWGIAPHPYCYSLPATRMLEYDTGEAFGDHQYGGMTGDPDTSSFLTYSNLEIIDLFLNREENLYEGKPRDVFLTESGVSSSHYYGFGAGYETTDSDDIAQSIQAAMIAYTWYKASQLSCVKVYAYYRLKDLWKEGGEPGGNFLPGLILSDEKGGGHKKSYDVWKYIDTQMSFEYSMKYIQYITYYDNYHGDRKYVTYGDGFNTYIDILDVFNSGYDFKNFDYKKAMPRWVGDKLGPSEYYPTPPTTEI